MTAIGEPFMEIDTTESTNALAMRAASSGSALPGTVWFAHEQTAGRGQRGRRWHSEPGTNLAMSVLLEAPFKSPSDAFPLSAATALATMEAVAGTGVHGLSVKWPNDLYHGDCKMGGILIENLVRGSRWTHAVVGIGINVNQTRFDPSLPNPVSVLQATGRPFPPLSLAHDLCRCLELRLKGLGEQGVDAIMQAYNGNLYRRGRTVKFRKDGVEFEAVPEKVLPDGRLVLNGQAPNVFRHGELDWVLPERD